jgi:hypothetical protein
MGALLLCTSIAGCSGGSPEATPGTAGGAGASGATGAGGAGIPARRGPGVMVGDPDAGPAGSGGSSAGGAGAGSGGASGAGGTAPRDGSAGTGGAIATGGAGTGGALGMGGAGQGGAGQGGALALDAGPVISPPAMGLGTYVSNTGNDSNPGTRTLPVRTITKGQQNARSLLGMTGMPQVVFVAEGHYAEKVALTENISLWGGHECNAGACTWTRNPQKYDSSIDNVDDEGVLVPAGVTRKTKLDGFRVRGRSGTPTLVQGSMCITVRGGTPSITGNRLELGNVKGSGRAVGIAVVAPGGPEPGGVLISKNEINGSSADRAAFGVVIEPWPGVVPGNGAAVTIENNQIRAGSAPSTTGIAAWSAAPGSVARGNQITGGSVPPGAQGSGSWGIQVQSALLIENNRINTDAGSVGTCMGSTWCGGINSFSATTTIVNNVVVGARALRSTALHLQEAEAPAGVAIVNGNVLDGGGVGLQGSGSLPTQSAAVVLRIGVCNNCGFTGFAGRLRNDILLGGNNVERFGVLEESTPNKTMHPEAFEANAIFFAPQPGGAPSRPGVLYRLWNGTTQTDLLTIADVTAQLMPKQGPPAGLQVVDPMLDGSFHLNKASPLIDKGTKTEAPLTDMDGEARPKGAGVDVGADEVAGG